MALGDSITNLSKAVQTLANGREDLFGTVKNLQVFSDALVANDSQVRKFNTQLDQVTSELASERGSLAAALKNLQQALTDIAGFIKQNGQAIHTDVVGLKDVVGVLNNQKAALNESWPPPRSRCRTWPTPTTRSRAPWTPATTSVAWPTRWIRP